MLRVQHLLVLFVLVALTTSVSLAQVTLTQPFPPPGAGYLDYNYGLEVDGAGRTPTEASPESKLWWNDGFWWGSMWNPPDMKYHIYRLNWGTQSWEDTGVPLDDRKESWSDTLWDATNKKLYIASHFAQLNPGDTNNPTNYARLYRYSYNEATHTYALDTDFPVNINHDKTEALTLAKDSTGRLWITYVSRVATEIPPKYRVYVNASTGNDASWDPYGATDLTTLSTITGTAHVLLNDISTIISFKDNDGSKVGILWSNQFSSTNPSLNFAWHLDSNNSYKNSADWTLQPALNRLAVTNPVSIVNDPMNIKALPTGNGDQLFAAVTFENQLQNPFQPAFPEIGLLARDVDGMFTYRTYSTVADNDARPLLLLNENDTTNNTDNVVDLFVSGLPQGSKICYKTLAIPAPPARLNTLSHFLAGNCGTGFIVDASGIYTTFRDPSSTKQNVNNSTGLVVFAADVNGRIYGHSSVGNPPPVITSVDPTYNAASAPLSSVVMATFSKPMDAATINNSTFFVTDGVTPVLGAFTYNPSTRTVTFAPTSPLKADTRYTVKLTSGIKDTTNLALDAYKNAPPNTVVEQWSFSIGGTTVQFTQPSYSVLENGGAAVITVTLTAAAAQPVTVDYATRDGTAVAPADYSNSTGTLTFNPGELRKTFTVSINDNQMPSSNKTVNLTLSNPNGALLGAQATATLTIIDNDASSLAYVANRGTGTISVIDCATNTVVATIPLPTGSAPQQLAITPDRRIYVTSQYIPGSVFVIDTASNTVVGEPIAVGNGPDGIAISPDGRFAYVANFFDAIPPNVNSTVLVIDLASNQVVSTIYVGFEPTGVLISPDGRYLYVANGGDATVSVIDTATNTVVGTPIDVGGLPEALAITPDGKKVYVTNLNTRNVSVIDTAAHAVQVTIQVGFLPLGLAISPDGQRIYVANIDSATNRGALAVIDTGTDTLLTQITLPANTTPRRVALTPDGRRAYVTDNPSSQVFVIDTATNSVVGEPIPVGIMPEGILITPGINAHFADLALTMADTPDPVYTGGILTYPLTITNDGPSDATSVTISDRLPPESKFVSVTSSQGSCAQANGNITCSLGNLANHATARVTITVTPTQGTSIINTAIVTANETDPDSTNNSASQTTTINQPPVGKNIFYLSAQYNGTIKGVKFNNEDILSFNPTTNAWTLLFDGSDVGLQKVNVDCFDVLNPAEDKPTVLLSFDKAIRLPNLGWVRSTDIVAFTYSAPPGPQTAGVFARYFTGADVGLTKSGEAIDACHLNPDGTLLLSTKGSFSVPGLSGQDEDLFTFTPNAGGLGANGPTSGTFSLFLDGTALGLTKGSEDVKGVWIDPLKPTDVYMVTGGNFTLTSGDKTLSGKKNDLFGCRRTSPTSCSDLFFLFNGDSVGFTHAIDGFNAVALPNQSSTAMRSMNSADDASEDATLQAYDVMGNEVDNTDPELDAYDLTNENDNALSPQIFLPIIQQ